MAGKESQFVIVVQSSICSKNDRFGKRNEHGWWGYAHLQKLGRKCGCFSGSFACAWLPSRKCDKMWHLFLCRSGGMGTDQTKRNASCATLPSSTRKNVLESWTLLAVVACQAAQGCLHLLAYTWPWQNNSIVAWRGCATTPASLPRKSSRAKPRLARPLATAMSCPVV